MYKNKLERYLGKNASDFTKKDIIRYIMENDIKLLNFRYAGGDGRLKELSFVFTSEKHLDEILTCGERVDGSSIFNYIEAGSSDLYIIPKYRTAFVNPFKENTLEVLCTCYSSDGSPLMSAPDNIMNRAHEVLVEKTGYELYAMGELEFYIMGKDDELYPANDQQGYHESTPFAKYRGIIEEAIPMIAEVGGHLKYAHSEVGNFKQGVKVFEQYEMEFLPTKMEEAANQLILAKWILRNIALKYGVTMSFAPKITVGKAGSGLHIHTKLMKDGKNAMIENNQLSDVAKRAIAGLLYLSPSLTAFGNTIPTSYLRLVPHQEAPTNICWGDRNRSVLIRVPLGWLGSANKMVQDANPNDASGFANYSDRQTVEFRCPDGSANIYLLMAGLAVAIRHGLEMENSLEYSEQNYVDVDIFKTENQQIQDKLKQLPLSCFESAENLLGQCEYFTKYNVFSKGVLETYAKSLKTYKDKGLSERLFGKQHDIKELVEEYIHCG